MIFLIEMLLQMFAVPGYLGGFFFWLDGIATASLLMDIPAVWYDLDA